MSKKVIFKRLPGHIKPLKYQLQIQPDLESGAFQGSESITVQIMEPTSSITLHSAELEILSAEVESVNKDTWASKVAYDKKAETATLKFKTKLPKGRAKINLSFRGLFNEHLRGYYKSHYEHKGEHKYLAATQFEATDARRAFPCFDEPNQKAVFELSLKIPSSHEAVSNTLPKATEEHDGGYKTVQFLPTPKMSTYLLAFISGEMEYLEKFSKHKVQVRVYTSLAKKAQGKFALDVAVKTLDFFEQYFQIRYPLPTLDLIALPDFASGAMENWGAVTFRESALLIEEDHSSLARKQWVATVIAHELAHQWFGNLVTMDWWSHLWLNEGFASYISFLAVDHIFPSWDMWNQFLSLDFKPGMNKDGLSSSHAIEVDIHDPNEIDEVFDDISYRKGASIIRMLADYLGHRTFKAGLHTYLEKHKYKNATTQDLWTALEKASGKPVGNMMSAWTTQVGFPLVTVKHKDQSLELTQQRFFRHPGKQDPAKSLWPVPLRFGKADGDLFLLTKKADLFSIKDNTTIPIKLNTSESAFVKINYEPEHWDKLAIQVKAEKLSTEDRWGIASSMWSLAEAGFLSTAKALELSLAFRKEKDYTVLKEIVENVIRAKLVFAEDAKQKRAFENYIQLLLEPNKKRLGLETVKNEPHSDQLLRPLVFRVLGENNDTALQEKAVQLLTRSLRGTPVPVHIRSAVYDVVACIGERPEHTLMKQLYAQASSAEERDRLASALATFSKTKLIEDTLNFSLSDTVRLQDKISFNRLVGAKQTQSRYLFDFTKRHWKEYQKLYGQGGRMLNLAVASLVYLPDEKTLSELKKFLLRQSQPGLERTINQTLETAELILRWKNRDKEEVTAFLNKYC